MKSTVSKQATHKNHGPVFRRQLTTGLTALGIAVLVYAIIAQPWKQSAPGGMVAGAVAPSFALPWLDGGAIIRLDDQAGKLVMVSFWATWCEPCKQELPALAKISAEMDPKRFQLITITDEPPTVVKVLLNELEHAHGQMPLMVLLDQGSRTQVAYGVRNLPTAIFVGPDKRVIRTHVGAQSESAWRADIQELFGQAFPGVVTR